ncbi:tRNA (adenosine(37)-N6)-dimethylallyltransferase MiaA [Pedobacter sp. SAFR-022]|uniref:tRNA (adenosine(37)-N6)-dimethylallyltransferase MiaA n=1 Tax=Pedobacter sp. SAFR-022 TaxID=3436861 RepID=UPI003F7F23AD
MALSKTLISIVGPTAVGKTALAIQVAQHLGTEIISADSRQFFKEMEIGTAKPSAEELSAAPHHFINSHHTTEFFSTGDFEIQVMELLEELFREKAQVVMCGGSGLYVNAVLNGLDELPATDLSIRAALNERFQSEGLEGIKAELASLDPEYYAQVDQFNTQRLIRGLEFVLSTGKKLSSFQQNSKKKRPFNILKIGLNKDRQALYNQINRRVDQMMALGLLEEVKRLLPYRELNALKTVGYAELFEYLDGNCSLAEAVDRIKQNTRRFAKRQLTWFRRDEEIKWFEPEQTTEILAYIDHYRSGQ